MSFNPSRFPPSLQRGSHSCSISNCVHGCCPRHCAFVRLPHAKRYVAIVMLLCFSCVIQSCQWLQITYVHVDLYTYVYSRTWQTLSAYLGYSRDCAFPSFSGFRQPSTAGGDQSQLDSFFHLISANKIVYINPNGKCDYWWSVKINGKMFDLIKNHIALWYCNKIIYNLIYNI